MKKTRSFGDLLSGSGSCRNGTCFVVGRQLSFLFVQCHLTSFTDSWYQAATLCHEGAQGATAIFSWMVAFADAPCILQSEHFGCVQPMRIQNKINTELSRTSTMAEMNVDTMRIACRNHTFQTQNNQSSEAVRSQ